MNLTLLTFLFLFLLPPSFLKPFRKRFVIGECNGFHLPHEVPVWAIMAVVTTEHATIVHPADQICHRAIRRLPNIFPQFGSAPRAIQDDRIVDDFRRDGLFRKSCPRLFRHFSILQQEGYSTKFDNLERRVIKLESPAQN
jgi:hypothetical protein